MLSPFPVSLPPPLLSDGFAGPKTVAFLVSLALGRSSVPGGTILQSGNSDAMMGMEKETSRLRRYLCAQEAEYHSGRGSLSYFGTSVSPTHVVCGCPFLNVMFSAHTDLLGPSDSAYCPSPFYSDPFSSPSLSGGPFL